MAITRTPMVDDDGSGTTGTIINNAWKQEMYDQIDAALGGGLTITTGTWTPTLTAEGGASGVAYTDRFGTWVRIGANFMLSTGFLQLSSKGTLTGNLQIGGWPVAFYGAGYSPIQIGFFSSMATNFSTLSGRSMPGSPLCQLFGVAAAGSTGMAPLGTADLTNASLFVFQASIYL